MNIYKLIMIWALCGLGTSLLPACGAPAPNSQLLDELREKNKKLQKEADLERQDQTSFYIQYKEDLCFINT